MGLIERLRKATPLEPDYGYRIRQPGISESVIDSHGGRGTGHFGTGVYFVSRPDHPALTPPESVYRFPIPPEARFYRPRDHDSAHDLHRGLQWINRAVHAPNGYQPHFGRPMDDAAMLQRADTHLVRGGILNATERLPDAVRFAREQLAELEASRDLRHTNPDLYWSMVRQSPSGSTRLMQSLGYDGVDVRHLPSLDNTEYGSVLYQPHAQAAVEGGVPHYGSVTPPLQRSWHLTDKPDFALDPEYHPANNTTLGGEWPHKGLFLGDPERWFNGYDYVRPFVAEIEHPPLDSFGGYGGESFLPAEAFPQSQVRRVIPTDEWVREHYGGRGWFEDYENPESVPYERFQNYRYEGPDVRDMPPEEIARHKDRVQNYIRDIRPHMLADHEGSVTPAVYYHVAPADDRADVQQNGIDWNRRDQTRDWRSAEDEEYYPHGNYLTTDLDRAREHARVSGGDIYTVTHDGRHLIPDPDEQWDGTSYYTPVPIAPDHLSLLEPHQGSVTPPDKGRYGAQGQVMYHVAPQAARSSIAEHGLDFGRGRGNTDYAYMEKTPGNYLWHDYAGAQGDGRHGDGPCDIWAVDASGLPLHPDEDVDGPGSYTTKPVPPERVNLHTEFPKVHGGPSEHTAETTRMAALTRSQLLRQRDLFEQNFGPDQAEVVHQFPNNWSIRRLMSPHAQDYEGELMGNCVGSARSLSYMDPAEYHAPDKYALDDDCYIYHSLRDPDNLPHASFVRGNDVTTYPDLDVEGRHGSNPGVYAPMIHDWWTNTLGQPPADPEWWLDEYGMDQQHTSDPGFEREPTDTFREQPQPFWQQYGPKDAPEYLRRLVRPMRKADEMVANGHTPEDAEGYLRNALRTRVKSEYVENAVRDWHRHRQETSRWQDDAVTVPNRREWPESYWMAKTYGPDVYDVVHDSQKLYRALPWNGPGIALGPMRGRLDELTGDPAKTDEITGHWWRAQTKMPMPARPEDLAWARAHEQARALKGTGSPLTVEEIANRLMHQSNILDPIKDELDGHVWEDPAAPEPHLKDHLRSWILSTVFEVLHNGGYNGMADWAKLVLTGSLTTYQYSHESDCDISIFVDSDQFPEWSRAEMIGLMIEGFDGVNLPGTSHELQVYVVPKQIKPADLYQYGLRSGYDLEHEAWIIPPDKNRVHDVEHEENESYTNGLIAADKMERLLRYEPDKAILLYQQVHRRRMADQKAGKGDFSDSNVVYKMLANRGLLDEIGKLMGKKLGSAPSSWSKLAADDPVPDYFPEEWAPEPEPDTIPWAHIMQVLKQMPHQEAQQQAEELARNHVEAQKAATGKNLVDADGNDWTDFMVHMRARTLLGECHRCQSTHKVVPGTGTLYENGKPGTLGGIPADLCAYCRGDEERPPKPRVLTQLTESEHGHPVIVDATSPRTVQVTEKRQHSDWDQCAQCGNGRKEHRYTEHELAKMTQWDRDRGHEASPEDYADWQPSALNHAKDQPPVTYHPYVEGDREPSQERYHFDRPSLDQAIANGGGAFKDISDMDWSLAHDNGVYHIRRPSDNPYSDPGFKVPAADFHTALGGFA